MTNATVIQKLLDERNFYSAAPQFPIKDLRGYLESMLYQLDVEVFRAIHVGLHQAWLDPIFAFFSYLGLGWGLTLCTFAGLLTPLGRRLFWPIIAALITGGLLAANEMKHLIPRDRPSNLPWAHPQEPIFQGSFPSGHTAASFSVAVTIFLFTRGTKQAWVGWVALAVASLIALSRIYRGVHWPSDVLGGICVGIFFGSLSYLVFNRGTEKDTAIPSNAAP